MPHHSPMPLPTTIQPPGATFPPPSDGAFRPPPQLPAPNAEEVSRFQSLFRARFGVELTQEQADDQARRLVQFVFLMQHAIPRLKDIQKDLQADKDLQAEQAQQEQVVMDEQAAADEA